MMTALAYARVQEHLGKLRLERVTAILDRVAEDAAKLELPYVEFLDRLLESRGDWAVHTGDYRGNWPPQFGDLAVFRVVVRNPIVLVDAPLSTLFDKPELARYNLHQGSLYSSLGKIIA